MGAVTPAAVARSAGHAALPFLLGTVLGLLSALATFSGRVASLETLATEHAQALRDIRTDVRTINAQLTELRQRRGL